MFERWRKRLSALVGEPSRVAQEATAPEQAVMPEQVSRAPAAAQRRLQEQVEQDASDADRHEELGSNGAR